MTRLRQGSYRWYLQQLGSTWAPRGIFNYLSSRFKVLGWHKEILLGDIQKTRKLLDELEAKLRG